MTPTSSKPASVAALFLVCLGAFVVSGCAMIDGKPRYRTQVTRIPPQTAQGRQCLNQCDSNRLQCETVQNAAFDRCEADRQDRFRECRRQASNARSHCLRNRAPSCDLSYSNTLNTCRFGIRDCRRDMSRCERMDSRCFQRCGGTLRTRRVCVANCDKIAAAPAAAQRVCQAGKEVRIAEKWPDGRPLRNKFCGRAICAVHGRVVGGPDSRGRCFVQPSLSPPSSRDWVPYQLLTLDR